MSQGWVLLWLAAAPATPAQQELLEQWAARNDVVLTAPLSDTDRPTVYAGETVAHIETLLERARLAVDGLDAALALELIDQARQTLSEHPELPQAPWLRAETFRVEADLARAESDAERADALELDATRLEGPRSRAAFAPNASAVTSLETSLPTLRTRSWTVSGLRPSNRLVWNGVVVEPPPRGEAWRVETTAGLQHARVLRGDTLVWAGWVEVSAESANIELNVPAPTPCSADDLAPWHVPDLAGVPIRCDRWIAARPLPSASSTDASAIEVARCHRDQCGAFERWPPKPRRAVPLAPEPEAGWLAGAPWWTYAAVGTVVATTATILLLSVTQRRDDERPVWVYGGIR